MKIAILVQVFPPRWLGGTEVSTYNMAKCLAKKGHNVCVVTSMDQGLPKQSTEQSFTICRVKTIQRKILLPLTYALSSLCALREIDPDIIHCQAIDTGLAGFLAKKLLGKGYVVWCRGADIYSRWPFKKLVSNLVVKNADAVMALTGDMKLQLQSVCQQPIFVIPNGIDLENFRRLPNHMSPYRHEKIILFVGRLHPVKGLVYLIEAMRIIASNESDVKLVIVGEGEQKEMLERLTREYCLDKQVVFAGRVPNEEVPKYMANADVFVLPSLSEGFPVTVLEAMASGLPIVASMVTGLSEIIEDGKNGFLTAPKSPQQIADKLQLLLNNDELRSNISRNNKQKASYYSWEKVAECLDQVYISTLRD